MNIATIGVYGATQQQFLDALRRARIRTLVDVRQRRAVRGAEYAWANSLRLQRALADAGLAYVHRPDLAPTTEMREQQYREDARLGVGKRNRTKLADVYRTRYLTEILARADLRSLLAMDHFALFCVERDAAACHRSLIAARLAAHGATVRHLVAGD